MKHARHFRNSLARGCGTILLLLTLAAGSGCGMFSNRVVFVDSRADVVRLGEDVRGHVFFQNEKGEWVRSGNKVKLPAGWYAGYLEKK